jgi:hypothetical protein
MFHTHYKEVLGEISEMTPAGIWKNGHPAHRETCPVVR